VIVPYGHLLVLSSILFFLGMFCTLTRRNLIMILLGVEVMLNAGAIAFVGAALRWMQVEGQVFALFILAVAGGEVSLGLALVVWVHRRTGSMDPGDVNELR